MRSVFEQEIARVQKEYPGAAETFIKAIEQGRVCGFSYAVNGVGCFYGHLFNFCEIEAVRFSERLVGEGYCDKGRTLTYIEDAIYDICKGDTHLSHPETLGCIRDICLAYRKEALCA